MSVPTNADRPARARSGYSLMEMLVVLAIMGLATAVILPSTSRMLDQATAHAVFFEFQRQVSDLRREASRTGLPLRLVEAGVDLDVVEENGAERRSVEVRSPWRYTLAPPLDIAEGGACSPTTANLINGDRVVMTLTENGGDCRFIRLQSGPGRPRAPASP
jgi:prepilin-type N-terminal cleavage/methylation domain-containing protein